MTTSVDFTPLAGDVWHSSGFEFRVDYVSETEVFVMRFAENSVVVPLRVDKITWEREARAMRFVRVPTTRGPKCEHGKLALLVAVPDEQRANKADDIAEAYAVEVGNNIPGGCIVWGLYHGRWVANVSARWLVSRFINDESFCCGRYTNTEKTVDCRETYCCHETGLMFVVVEYNDSEDCHLKTESGQPVTRLSAHKVIVHTGKLGGVVAFKQSRSPVGREIENGATE